MTYSIRSLRLHACLTDRRLAAALALGMGLWAVPARAHIEMLMPAARYTPDMQKDDPCGHPMNPPGKNPPHVFQAGETITIEFEEFVDHTGHFRVAVDLTGTDDFTSPMGFEDFYNSPEVILDDIPDDQDGGLHTVEVTLPDTPCDPCTLQLIQVMTDDGAWGPGNDDLYFQCADIVLEPAPAGDTGDTGSGDTTGAGDTTSGGDESTAGPIDPDTGEPGDGDDDDSAGSNTGGINPGTSDGGTADSDSSDEGGCSCRADAGGTTTAPWLLLALMAGVRRRGTKRGRRAQRT